MAAPAGTWGSPGTIAPGAHRRPRVELVAGWTALARIEHEWREVSGRDPFPVPARAWDAAAALRENGMPRALPGALLARRGGELAVLLPVEIHRTVLGVPLVRCLGAGLLPHHEPLLAPGAETIDAARVFAGLARALGRQPILDLGPLRPDGAGTRWLVRALGERLGWSVLPGLREYRVDLAGGWNRVRLSLPLPLREDARHGLDRARRRAPTRCTFLRAREAGLVRQVEALGPAGASGTPREAIAASLLARGARRGRLVVGRLVHDGRLIAGLVAWVENRQATLLLVRDDGAHRAFHPRRVLLVGLVRHLVEREDCARLLLPPARHDAGLGLVPREQVRLAGTLRGGLARVLAGLGLRLGGGRGVRLPAVPWPGPAGETGCRRARLGRAERILRVPWRPVPLPPFPALLPASAARSARSAAAPALS